MSWRDLHETYGQGKSRELLNRAIRAEVPGGGELIDACHKIGVELDNPRRDRQPEDLHDLRKAREALTALLDRLRDGVCRRYGVGSDREDATPTGAAVRLSELTPPKRDGPATAAAGKPEGWHPPPSAVAQMGSEAHQAIARDYGVSGETVSRAASRLGAGGRKKIAWTDAVLRQLSDTPDNPRVAAKLGISVASVKTARSRYKDRIARLGPHDEN